MTWARMWSCASRTEIMAGIIATVNDGGARPAPPAGFWIRAVAVLVDGVVIWLAGLSMGFAGARLGGPGIDEWSGYQGLVGFFTLLFACVYTTVTHAAGGQTIGKALLGIRVVAVDGQLLPVGAALLRWLAMLVSALPFGMGFVMAGLRPDKRALHDLIAGSRVEWSTRVERPARARGAGARARDAEVPATAPWPPAGSPVGAPPTGARIEGPTSPTRVDPPTSAPPEAPSPPAGA